MPQKKEGRRGGRGDWASKGKAAPGGGAGSRGSSRGAAAGKPEPGVDADVSQFLIPRPGQSASARRKQFGESLIL